MHYLLRAINNYSGKSRRQWRAQSIDDVGAIPIRSTLLKPLQLPFLSIHFF